MTVRATPLSAHRAHPEPAEPDARRTTRLARTLTYGLCGGLLLLGIAQVEIWPLSAFRLFSGVRGPETTSWQVVVVDPDGSERLLNLAGMPDRVGLPHHVLPRLVEAPPAAREDVLETYAEAAGAGTSAVRVRVYRVVSRTSTEPDVANIQLSRHIAYEVGLP